MNTLTVTQVAERLQVTEKTVTGWIRSKSLKAFDVSLRPGTGKPRYRIQEADLREFQSKRQVGTAKPRRKKPSKPKGVIQFYV